MCACVLLFAFSFAVFGHRILINALPLSSADTHHSVSETSQSPVQFYGFWDYLPADIRVALLTVSTFAIAKHWKLTCFLAWTSASEDFISRYTKALIISPPAGLLFDLRHSFFFFDCCPFHSTTGAGILTWIVILTPSIKIFLRLKIW